MTKNYFITGDTHGRVMERLANIPSFYEPSETALIILGDAGFNFYLNNTDRNLKRQVNDTGYTVYCVRGNHEERPENLPYIVYEYDQEVGNTIIFEPDFPNIRYLLDGGEYDINGYSVLVIGGAYSVDKWWRLGNAPKDAKWTGWFEQEQLDEYERAEILQKVKGKKYDFVFTHTCPICWEPRDLFLDAVDQSTVDKSMENWLQEVKNNITYHTWCFGHYHDDRLERPHVEQFFKDIENLDDVYDRWTGYNETGKLDWWLTTSPNFYFDDSKEFVE